MLALLSFAPTPALPARGRELSLRSLPAIDTHRHSVEKRNPVMLVANILASVLQWAKQSTNKNSSSFKHSYNLIGIMDSDFRRNDDGGNSWHTGLLRRFAPRNDDRTTTTTTGTII